MMEYNRETIVKRSFFVVLSALLLVGLTSCPNSSGGELLYSIDPPEKIPPNSASLVRNALFIDTGQPGAVEILTGAGNYVLAESGFQYFDYVIISGAKIKRGKVNAHLDYSESLMSIVQNWKTLIKPLRDKGMKVLFAISGGSDGVSFGSLTRAEQALFARECADFCKYYGLDGVEFNDVGGESTTQNPYPEYGGSFWNGEIIVDIPEDDMTRYEKSWEEGAGNFADMLSYLIETLGASNSFQGDISTDAKEKTPILVREVNFGKNLPIAVPRYAFAATSSCLSFIINDTEKFGFDDSGNSAMDWVGGRIYAPVVIDLGNVTPDLLQEYSKRLGRKSYGTEDEELYSSEYGLVYYTNMQLPLAGNVDDLTITAEEVFGEAVSYIDTATTRSP
jgi:hypothetical protein